MSSLRYLLTDERGAAPLDRVVILAGTAVVLVLGAHELFLFGVDTLVAMVESDTVAYRSGTVEDVAPSR